MENLEFRELNFFRVEIKSISDSWNSCCGFLLKLLSQKICFHVV